MDVQLDDERRDVTIGTDEPPFADDEEDDNGLPRVVSIRTGGGWDVTLTLPDGRRTTFAFAPTVNSEDSIATARWKAPPDVQYGLVPLDSGIINLVLGRPPVWQDTDNTFVPGTLENHDIRGWLLTNHDGTQYVISRGAANDVIWDPNRNGQFISVRAYGPPKLTEIHQRSGDWLEITDRGLFHHNPTNGLTRSVVMERDSEDRISAIWDPNSPTNGPATLRYIYHRETGNLLQVLKLIDRTAGTYITNKYHYDNATFPHYLTSIENPLGVPVARNEYDDSGRLTAVIDADGRRTEFHHDLTNHYEVVIDRMGRTTTHAYDPNGNVTASTNALGEYTLMTYDTNNQVRSVTDGLGHTMSYDYDDKGNQTQVINALGKTNFMAYDEFNNLIGTKDPLGNWTTNYYDEYGQLTNTVQKAPAERRWAKAFQDIWVVC